ncbi:MAG TPA: hypothetical protein VF941_25020 [Clostridia bacterium]
MNNSSQRNECLLCAIGSYSEPEHERTELMSTLLGNSILKSTDILKEMDLIIQDFQANMRYQYEIYAYKNPPDFKTYKQALKYYISVTYPWIDEITFSSLYGCFSYR